VASLLDESIRTTDSVARYGGEEFVVTMPNTDIEGAALLADRLRQKIEKSSAFDMPVTVSGGLALAMEGETGQHMMARADEALYQAKANGRNRLHVHTGAAVVPLSEFETSEPEASPVV
jgi:diguanylate cyclase (GGDEF)-like protein